MRRTGLLILIVVVAFLMGGPYTRQARADTSDDLLAYVAEAYSNLLMLDSFTADSDQVYDVKLNLKDLRLEIDFNYTAHITSEVTPRDTFRGYAAFDISMTSNVQPGPTKVEMAMFLDGTTVYARVGGDTLAQGGQAGSISSGWVNTDLLDNNASPAYHAMNAPTFFQLFGLNYLFQPEAVASVRELEPQDVDGQKMRVIEILYTSLNLDASGTLDGMIEVFNGQATGFTEDMTRDMLRNGSGYTFTVWIGEDDHLPHAFADYIEIESWISYQGYKTTVSGTLTTATNLTGINTPLTLTPPEVD